MPAGLWSGILKQTGWLLFLEVIGPEIKLDYALSHQKLGLAKLAGTR